MGPHSLRSFCKAPLSPIAKFCSECGAKVPLASLQPSPAPGERRQVTVLFADITGYTRLSKAAERLLSFDHVDQYYMQGGPKFVTYMTRGVASTV